MKVYIAGPMTGLPNLNYEAFYSAESALFEVSNEFLNGSLHVLNPARHFDGDQSRERVEYLHAALTSVLEADVVVVLHGADKSEGVRVELIVAEAVGKKVFRFTDFIDWASFQCDPEHEPPQYNVHCVGSPRAYALDTAKGLITGDRNNQYGPPTQDFQRIADMATAMGYRGTGNRKWESHDVAIFMILLKLSRLSWNWKKEDSWFDLLGYGACGWECVSNE